MKFLLKPFLFLGALLSTITYFFRGLVSNRSGQGMVEYGLILALIAIAVIAALTALGGQLDSNFNDIKTDLTPSTT